MLSSRLAVMIIGHVSCATKSPSRCASRARRSAVTNFGTRVGVRPLGYAVETGLLESNPADHLRWHIPKSCAALTWKPLYFSPLAASRSSVGVRIGPPKVPRLPKPASRSSGRSCAHPSRRGVAAVEAVRQPVREHLSLPRKSGLRLVGGIFTPR